MIRLRSTLYFAAFAKNQLEASAHPRPRRERSPPSRAGTRHLLPQNLFQVRQTVPLDHGFLGASRPSPSVDDDDAGPPPCHGGFRLENVKDRSLYCIGMFHSTETQSGSFGGSWAGRIRTRAQGQTERAPVSAYAY